VIRGPYKTKGRREMTTKQLAREYVLRRAEPQAAELKVMFPDFTEAELNEVWLAVNAAIVKVVWY
jgi:23S rRNA maturation mini-RNase III